MGFMSDETMSDAQKKRLNTFFNEGLKVMLEIDDLKASLKDLSKTVGEELNVKPALLNKALRTAFKATMAEEKEKIETVEDILVAVGRA